MKGQRPVNLNLMTLRYPLMAITSILHRITGLILVLCVPGFVWLVDYSLSSEAQFETLRQYMYHPSFRLLCWLLLSFVTYHLFAGIRHIIMDFGYGEEVNYARRSAMVLVSLTIIAMVALAVWLW